MTEFYIKRQGLPDTFLTINGRKFITNSQEEAYKVLDGLQSIKDYNRTIFKDWAVYFSVIDKNKYRL